jgi:hypothetical protein
MEVEPDSVVQLESGKFYHISFSEAPSKGALEAFQKSLKDHGVRAVITLGNVSVADLCVLFQGLGEADREAIRKSLDFIDPREHEQAK